MISIHGWLIGDAILRKQGDLYCWKPFHTSAINEIAKHLAEEDLDLQLNIRSFMTPAIARDLEWCVREHYIHSNHQPIIYSIGATSSIRTRQQSIMIDTAETSRRYLIELPKKLAMQQYYNGNILIQESVTTCGTQ